MLENQADIVHQFDKMTRLDDKNETNWVMFVTSLKSIDQCQGKEK